MAPVHGVRIAASLFVVLPSLAVAEGYAVTVRGGNKLAAIAFATKESYRRPCWLEAKQISLALPATSGEGHGTPGRIEFVAGVDTSRDCFESEGPQRGVIAFANESGARLPAIPFGRYQLRIDGKAYGTLVAGVNAVELVAD